MSHSSYDAVALFSGGLDSILAARMIQDQGLAVKCLHFVSPFFGNPAKVPYWQKAYGLDITAVDIGDAFAAMLAERPVHGFGSVLNPCVDCKILMLSTARARMSEYGAKIIVSGEVLGQRPMSQRRDTLNIIRRDADVRDVLLRPLSAKLMEETPAETTGLVDRARLGAISGRGRKDQLELAARYGIRDIPTPAGGCKLTERENGRSYWPVLHYMGRPTGNDFSLAGSGRQYWSFAAEPPLWLCVGRNQADNEALLRLAQPGDMLFKTASFPGPVSLARPLPDQVWDDAAVGAAAAFTASFSPKAVKAFAENGAEIRVKVCSGSDPAAVLRPAEDGTSPVVAVRPDRVTAHNWREYAWDEAREAIKAEARARHQK
ncbi:tRNA(5-methylaminomethyl-2-thiouridylate) methyltransferase [Desulfovibrio sp. OttesenSCG-928-O18]|nr:tRNA(5-methylaminomethyl-2-thiouridylate) methyltransferase [Desulfovibrio sp. OttesenSCG-928-O18]